MKTKLKLQLLLLLAGLSTFDSQLSTLFAQGTAFTYQGRLNDGASPANGIYDFRFRIAIDPFANDYAAPAFFTNRVPVANGLFTVTIDFGGGVFTGASRWLEIGLRTNGTGAYITLDPIQPLTAAPHAIVAYSASNLLGSLPANQLSGALPSAQLAGAYSSALTLSNPANSFIGDGSGLTTVNASALGGVGASGFWKLSGNGVAPEQFVGSTNFQAVEIRVNALRGWRVEPDPRPGGIAANLIGGSTNNAIEGENSGGNVIVGGGSLVRPNVVHSNSSGVFIGAGTGNHIGPNINDAVIGGGRQNTIQSNAIYSIIGGGVQNRIHSFVGTIGGGQQNTIQTNAGFSTIGGGVNNTNHGAQVTIGGGYLNTVQANADYSTIGGGYFNTIQTIASHSTVGGGRDNTIQTNASYSTVGGGYQNTVQAHAGNSIIGGGYLNTIETGAFQGAIGGGEFNTIQTSAQYSTIGGGANNRIVANAQRATIPGGSRNSAASDAFAAGHRAKANHQGAFVWADSTDADFGSTANNQFLIRASGGVGIGTRSPQTQLHIAGAGGEQLRLEDTAFLNYWNIYTEALATSSASGNLVFAPKAGVFGFIRKSDGNYFSGSDARLKKDIHALGGVLDRVLRLRPVSYRFKTAPASASPTIGLIAQEVEPLFPEVVGEHNGMKALAYSELVPVTVGAIQELNEKVEETRAENAELKRELSEIKRLLRNLSGKKD